MWNVLECGGSGRGKRGKKEKKGGSTDEKKKEKKKKGKNKIKNKKLKLRNAITIFSQKILSGKLLLANIGEKKIIFLKREKII